MLEKKKIDIYIYIFIFISKKRGADIACVIIGVGDNCEIGVSARKYRCALKQRNHRNRQFRISRTKVNHDRRPVINYLIFIELLKESIYAVKMKRVKGQLKDKGEQVQRILVEGEVECKESER